MDKKVIFFASDRLKLDESGNELNGEEEDTPGVEYKEQEVFQNGVYR